MSAIIKVPNPLTDAQITAIRDNLAAIKLILDGAAVSITKSQTKSMIKVSTMRVALIKDVNMRLIKIFPSVVPASIAPVNFDADMAYTGKLSVLMGMINAQTNGIGGLLKISNSNLMTKTTMILDNARVDEKTNPVMAISMNKISAKHFNSKPGKHKPTSYGLPVGVKTTLSGLISGRMFTNAGAGILSLLKVDGNVEDAVSVYPFSGIKIPKGWINVVVTNLSETEGASFKVYIKAKAK